MTAPRISVLDPAGPQAGTIAALWQVFLWISIVVFAVVVVAFAIATIHAVRRRRRDGAADPLAGDPARDRRMIRGVIAAGGVTVVTLLVLLVASVRSGSALAALEDDADPLHIRITGRQWWWQIEYEHDDPARSATTANELHIPVGRTVHLELTSADVIHSFWVPSIHGKKDLIPGRLNRTAWTNPPDQPVVYGVRADRPELLVTRLMDADPDHRSELASHTLAPLFTALATGVTFIGSIFTPWAVPIGAVGVAAALIGWFWPRRPHREEMLEAHP